MISSAVSVSRTIMMCQASSESEARHSQSECRCPVYLHMKILTSCLPQTCSRFRRFTRDVRRALDAVSSTIS